MRQAPLVSRPWRRFVVGGNRDVDRRYYMFCTLERLQDALRRRDLLILDDRAVEIVWPDPGRGRLR